MRSVGAKRGSSDTSHSLLPTEFVARRCLSQALGQSTTSISGFRVGTMGRAVLFLGAYWLSYAHNQRCTPTGRNQNQRMPSCHSLRSQACVLSVMTSMRVHTYVQDAFPVRSSQAA